MPAKIPVPMSRGREVSIEGCTGTRESSAIVIGSALTDLGALPPARSTRLRRRPRVSRRSRIDTSRPRASCTPRESRTMDGSTCSVADADGTFQARVLGSGPAVGQSLIDARVRIRGVADTTFNTRGQAVRPQVLVSSLNDIQSTKPERPSRSRSPCSPSRACSKRLRHGLETSRAGAGHDHPASGRHLVT